MKRNHLSPSQREPRSINSPWQPQPRGWMSETHPLSAEWLKCFLLTSPFIEPAIDAIPIASHHQRKLKSGAASAQPPPGSSHTSRQKPSRRMRHPRTLAIWETWSGRIRSWSSVGRGLSTLRKQNCFFHFWRRKKSSYLKGPARASGIRRDPPSRVANSERPSAHRAVFHLIDASG